MLTRSNGEQLFTFPVDSILAVAQPARTQLDLQVNVMLCLNLLAKCLPREDMKPCLYTCRCCCQMNAVARSGFKLQGLGPISGQSQISMRS